MCGRSLLLQYFLSCIRRDTFKVTPSPSALSPALEKWQTLYYQVINACLVSFQSQGLVEHFRDSCGGVIKWLDDSTYYTAFSEGWALYAENPLIARETNVYDNEPFQKFGMLKWQVCVW